MKNRYIFILSLSFVCSILLALFSEGLKSKTLFNKKLDKKKNILATVGIDIVKMSNEEIIKSFNNNIKEITLDLNGNQAYSIGHDKLKIIEDNITAELKYMYGNLRQM